MGRWAGYGRRTVEQTRSVDIEALRRAGFVGKPRATWWVHRQRLFREGIRPTHWNDNAITLDSQRLSVVRLAWHFSGQRVYFWCACGRRVRKLCAPRGRPWRCRHCYGLTYATRQATLRDRLLIKARHTKWKLLGCDSNAKTETPTNFMVSAELSGLVMIVSAPTCWISPCCIIVARSPNSARESTRVS